MMRWRRSYQRLRMVHIVVVVRWPARRILVRIRDASIRPVRTYRYGLIIIVPAIPELQVSLSSRIYCISFGGILRLFLSSSSKFWRLFAFGLCRHLGGFILSCCCRHVLNHCQRGNQHNEQLHPARSSSYRLRRRRNNTKKLFSCHCSALLDLTNFWVSNFLLTPRGAFANFLHAIQTANCAHDTERGVCH